ncbi:MAG TPA: phage holin family protein [Solirubrobacteraceae bacterium]|nr:phage holin family protein [Solirubrobacteraceae bacterium]
MSREQAPARGVPEQQSRRSPIWRILAVWVLSAATLGALSGLLSGVHVDSVGAAFAAAAVIGLLNALAWPLILRFALPLTVLTLGFGAIVLNGAIVLLASQIDIGFEVSSLFAGIVVTLAVTLVTTVASSVLAIDDDGFWYRHVVARYGKRTAPARDLDVPGIVFLEIDGLAHSVLLRAIRDGNAPNLSRWLRVGSHQLARWETDWSSQTGACQAGLLHGNNDDMPAFRWWEKDRDTAIVTNHPRDAAELERRHSDGRGLLFADGASRANIVSGDAPHSLLTMSTVLNRDRHSRIGQDYFAYFADPYNCTRTFLLVVREVFSELWSASRQRRLDVQPRVPRSFMYALVRAWATVIQRDLQVNSVIGDMYTGRPVVYTTFLAYDEVAHHSGIERPETLTTLRALDRQIGRIAKAAQFAPRAYKLVVLSDHGQSQGATFLDRYGITLEQLVHSAVDAGTVSVEGASSEALGFVGASLTEVSGGEAMPSRMVRRLSRGHAEEGEVHIGEPRAKPELSAGGESPELVVMASGCLGLVSFPREPGRVTLERIESLYPRLIPALREHPGIGFILVRSEEHGAVVLGRDGIRMLDRDRVEGDDPLAPFGENAARHVSRTDGFPHCPDIVVNSTYWSQSDEVAAFEELVGSHGGLGGSQSYPFLLHPVELALPAQELVGAEAVHRELRRWLVELGHREYAPVLAPPGPESHPAEAHPAEPHTPAAHPPATLPAEG